MQRKLFENPALEESIVQVKQPVLAALAALILAFGPSSAFAETKIAVVDVQRAILNSEEAQQKMQQIQSEFKGDEEEIKELQADATALAERLQKDADVMSDSEKQKLQRQIQSKNEDFQYLRNRLQKRIESRQQELFAGTDEKVQKAIQSLVVSEDYDVIIPRQAVLYAGEVYDITARVTEELNKMGQQ